MVGNLEKRGAGVWEIAPSGGMRVPARIYASDALLAGIRGDQSLTQACNVAHLPGIVTASLAMPDMHEGYGFPIGGVAAFDADDGIVSPGGVGYDINCGVRLFRTDVRAAELGDRLRATRPPDPARRTGRRRQRGRDRDPLRPRPRRRPDARLGVGRRARLRRNPRTWHSPRRAAAFRAPTRPRCRRAPASAARRSSARSAPATTSPRCRSSTKCSTARPPPPSGWSRAT